LIGAAMAATEVKSHHEKQAQNLTSQQEILLAGSARAMYVFHCMAGLTAGPAID
jgi:hypothetical protein